MTKLVLLLVLLLLSGCITDREAGLFYTRAEVDAINAGAQCRALARNLVQIARCDGRRF